MNERTERVHTRTEKLKISDLPLFDMADHLDSDEAVAEYLTLVIADGDPALLSAALADIAEARGMTQIAKDTGIGRESL